LHRKVASALATAYQQQSSDPRVEIGKGLGTRARLQALAEGKIQIAPASHGIKPEDVQKGNLKVIEVAKGAAPWEDELWDCVRQEMKRVCANCGTKPTSVT